MQSRILRSVAFAAVMVVSVAACSGAPGGASQNEPAGAVEAALDAAQSGGFSKLADYACAAKKDDVAGLLGGEGMGALTQLGVDPDDVFDAVKIELKDVRTTEKSRSGNNAVVGLTGSMVVTLDPAKVRDLMKQMMEAQGQSIDDATLDAMIASMSSQLTTTESLDSDVPVVLEGGKWLICG